MEAPTNLKFKPEIQQMMYVAGETQECSSETIGVIENIIRDQVVHMITKANELAARRGSRVFSNNDIIFQLRHDRARLARLRTFIAWKGIRKTAKDPDDKGDIPIDALLDDAASIETGGAEDPDGTALPLGAAGKLPTVALPWDPEFFYSVQPPDNGGWDDANDDSNEAALEKLRYADEITRNMTAAEYAVWSDYRHASFTWRKGKRFREWCGLGVIAENRPTDDVLDIFGFLTSEMVQNLTAEALRVQQDEIVRQARDAARSDASTRSGRETLFGKIKETRSAIEPRHVREAFQRLQTPPKRSRAFHQGTMFGNHGDLRLI